MFNFDLGGPTAPFHDLVPFEDYRHNHNYEEEYYGGKRKERVYIVLEGIEYPVSNESCEMLINGTDPMEQSHKKIRFLDIKGLGFMKYRERSIVSAGRDGGLIYYMKFDMAVIG